MHVTDQPDQALLTLTIEQPKQASISLTLAEIEDLIPVLDFEIAGLEKSIAAMDKLGDEETWLGTSGLCDRITLLRDRLDLHAHQLREAGLAELTELTALSEECGGYTELAEGLSTTPAPADRYDFVAFEAERRVSGALPKSFKIVDGYIVVLDDGSIGRSTLPFQGGQAAVWWTCDSEELFGTSGVAEAGEQIGSEFTSSYFLTKTELPTKMAQWFCIDQASRTFQYHREVAAGVRTDHYRSN